MLWAANNTKLSSIYFSSHVQLKSLENWLAKDEDLRENLTSTIREDLNKRYLIEFTDARKFKLE